MADVLYILTFTAFFALMVAFVRVCERMVGRDDAVDVGPDVDGETTETRVGAPEEVPA